MTQLDKLGKGIILMHDFQKHTADALPELLRRLKAGGYKMVQMKSKAPAQTLAEYDEMVLKDAKVPVSSGGPSTAWCRRFRSNIRRIKRRRRSCRSRPRPELI